MKDILLSYSFRHEWKLPQILTKHEFEELHSFVSHLLCEQVTAALKEFPKEAPIRRSFCLSHVGFMTVPPGMYKMISSFLNLNSIAMLMVVNTQTRGEISPGRKSGTLHISRASARITKMISSQQKYVSSTF